MCQKLSSKQHAVPRDAIVQQECSRIFPLEKAKLVGNIPLQTFSILVYQPGVMVYQLVAAQKGDKFGNFLPIPDVVLVAGSDEFPLTFLKYLLEIGLETDSDGISVDVEEFGKSTLIALKNIPSTIRRMVVTNSDFQARIALPD